MALNVQPIYTGTPRMDSGQNNNSGTILGPSANTAEDGTGANTFAVFRAGTNGSYLRAVYFVPVLSPAATKARLWICQNNTTPFTPNTTNTATNMASLLEVTLPAVTVSLTVQGANTIVPIGQTIPAGYWLVVTFETSTGSAGTGWSVVCFGGDY